MAASKFTLLAHEVWSERVAKIVPSFDCRAFAVPSRIEAVNALVWRELDASRNALQAVAQSRFAPDEIHGKSSDELEVMLGTIGVKMIDYPIALRYGQYLARRAVEVTLSDEDLSRIPKQHRPAGSVVPSRVVDLDIAPIAKRADRLDLVFGADSRLADAAVSP
jgi:tRNA(His) 5'-end guanylyltransferase